MQLRLPTILILCLTVVSSICSQGFYFGADLSYVNEMNDCGVTYSDDKGEREVYQIFADHNCSLARIRTWHSPSWYDDLNEGRRYSDHADIERSISRAKAAGMDVLLDFHLSDTWADPGRQIAPAAWNDVLDDTEVLGDSLYNYLYRSLEKLNAKGLLPEMVQIGNETNKGILQSKEDNDSGWKLDWDRNAALFNDGIRAVRDFSETSGKEIQIMIHAAGPADAVWLFEQFIDNGVTDFDIMGISYYWAWHKPTDIADAGKIVRDLMKDYPGYDVMIAETGYIWTTESNDDANNIISEVHPEYAPASPENQRDWLIAMTTEMIESGATGVIYWEPAWQSSPCWTQWGRGSHQEHATFFDFDNQMLDNGGMNWMTHDYGLSTSTSVIPQSETIQFEAFVDSTGSTLRFRVNGRDAYGKVSMFTASGELVRSTMGDFLSGEWTSRDLPNLPSGMYVVQLELVTGAKAIAKVMIVD